MDEKEIKLGNCYTDVVTGFTGFATIRSEMFRNPTKRICLEDKEGRNGKVIEQWFDETRLKQAEGSPYIE